MREAELKHGRVAMLATVGYLCTQAGIHLPGNDGLYANPNPIDAVFQVGPAVMLQIVGLIGVLESLNHNGRLSMDNMHEGISFDQVGEFTNPIYGAKMLKKKTPEQAAELKLKELKNGRLAMLAKRHKDPATDVGSRIPSIAGPHEDCDFSLPDAR